ncbi:hypothetical protein C0J52_27240 [Blattella germanica]|nr:hypothetical protein C0J52_27240 [Blattella germanica]
MRNNAFDSSSYGGGRSYAGDGTNQTGGGYSGHPPVPGCRNVMFIARNSIMVWDLPICMLVNNLYPGFLTFPCPSQVLPQPARSASNRILLLVLTQDRVTQVWRPRRTQGARGHRGEVTTANPAKPPASTHIDACKLEWTRQDEETICID